MTKAKIDIPKEVAKIWQQAKKNVKELSQRTVVLAQKGEKQVVRTSKIGKLQLDIISINLKKENIFRQVGKKVYQAHSKKKQMRTERLVSLFSQIDKLNQQIKSRKAKIAQLNRG